MNAIDAVIFFSERLNAERSLLSDETDVLCQMIGKQVPRVSRVWTADEDRAVLRQARKNPRGYAMALAETLGRSPWAIRNRLRRLKEKR